MVRVDARTVLVKMVENRPEYDVILENDAIFANMVDVVNVLARIVEKSPTFTASDEIVAELAFIVENDAVENDAIFANRLDVYDVLARRVEKVPT